MSPNTFDVHDGCIWLGSSRTLSVSPADDIAQANGLQFAEQFVRQYDGQRITLDDAWKVIAQVAIPAPGRVYAKDAEPVLCDSCIFAYCLGSVSIGDQTMGQRYCDEWRDKVNIIGGGMSECSVYTSKS